jgi:alkyl hydroperoxide reductase subunit AhpC
LIHNHPGVQVTEQDVATVQQGGIAFTIRSVFVIDPNKKIRLTMTYPASTGRNSAEVLRCVDSLQTTDKQGVATPIDWQVGQDVIVPPSVSTEDAKAKYGESNVRVVKPFVKPFRKFCSTSLTFQQLSSLH